jgi:hypothetical protein
MQASASQEGLIDAPNINREHHMFIININQRCCSATLADSCGALLMPAKFINLKLMVLTISSCLFVKEIQNGGLLASKKSLTNCEIPSNNPLQISFLIAVCAPNSCSESRL